MRKLLLPLMVSLALGASCTSTEDEEIKEPVVEDPDTSTYPEDPDLAATETPSEDSVVADNGEPEGALTDDPFGAPPAPGTMEETDDDALLGDSGPSGEAPEIPSTDIYSEAFGDDDIAAQESPTPEPPTPLSSTPVYEPEEPTTKATASRKTVTRYVNAILLNVRSGPSLRAPIVRRLLGGARVQVELGHPNGFAKLRDGQYLKAKYLSSKPTRKVSRVEAAKAWERSKYKDTWKP